MPDPSPEIELEFSEWLDAYADAWESDLRAQWDTTQMAIEDQPHSGEIAAELVGAGILSAVDLVKAARAEMKSRLKKKTA